MKVSMSSIRGLLVVLLMRWHPSKKLSNLLSISSQIQILNKCLPMQWQSLLLRQKQGWLLQTLINRIRTTGSLCHIFVVWNTATFSQFAMVMASGEEKFQHIWKTNFHYFWKRNSNSCFKNMKKIWPKRRSFKSWTLMRFASLSIMPS